MAGSKDENSRQSRRLTRATTRRLDEATRLINGVSMSDAPEKVDAVRNFGNKSPENLNGLLGALSRSDRKTVAEQRLSEYLTTKLTEVLGKLSQSKSEEPISEGEFQSIRALVRVNQPMRDNFFNFLKSLDTSNNGFIFAQLIVHDAFNLIAHGEDLKELLQNDKLGDSKKPIQMLLQVNDFIQNKSGNIHQIETLSEDDNARAVLVNALKLDRYSNAIDQIEVIIRSDALKEEDLFELLVHYRKNRETYGDFLTEAITNKLRDNPNLTQSTVETKITSIEEQVKNSEAPTLGERIVETLLKPLKGFGLKTEAGERWAAITNNAFDEEGMMAQSSRDFAVKIGAEMGLWVGTRDFKISKINFPRAINPIVLLHYGLILAEVGVQRLTHAIPNKVIRGIVQFPVALIVHVSNLVLNILGQLTPIVSGEKEDKKNERKETSSGASDADTSSLDDTASVESPRVAFSNFDEKTLASGASSDYESESSPRFESVTSRSEEAKAASREKIQHADPATLSAAKGIFENAEKKYSNRQFDYYEFASTRRPWAIMNFMSHSVFKENISTEFDNAIVQVMLNQKSSEPDFNRKIIQVMALRNAIAEHERLDPKTPSVEIAIEEMKLKLDRSISEIESLQGGMKMTDTTQASRKDAAKESLSTFNLGDVGDKAGLVDGGSSDAELSGESPREGEALLGGKEPEEPVSLFGRLRQAVAGLFGVGGKAEAKTEAEAAGTKVAEYEYNQVRLNGYADKFKGKEDDFKVWLNAQEGRLEVVNEKEFGKFPIEFKGGQRIELSGDGKDVVMKGFSAEACKSFGKKMIFEFTPPDSISISATSPSSVKEISDSMDAKSHATFRSVLTSVGLMFQQVGSAIKSFFTGPPTPAAQTVKSEPSVAKADEASRVSVEKSEVARTPKPAPVPTSTASVVVDEKRNSLPPTPVSVIPKIERREITSAPAKGIPLWVSRVKVTVASNNDLQSTQATVTNYANTHGFRDVQVEQKPHSLSMQLEDNKGGRLSISAQQGKPVVDIEEVKRSDDTPNHIANIATDLPNKGPKDVTVNGRESMKEKVQTALTTVGDHKITTAADKENLSHVANQPAPHK